MSPGEEARRMMKAAGRATSKVEMFLALAAMREAMAVRIEEHGGRVIDMERCRSGGRHYEAIAEKIAAGGTCEMCPLISKAIRENPVDVFVISQWEAATNRAAVV